MKHGRFEIVKVGYGDGASVEIYCDDCIFLELNETENGDSDVSFFERKEISREDFELFLRLIEEGMTWLGWKRNQLH